MQHMLKNGNFVERRRMFIQAPFHNMKSNVPLNWSAQQATTQQLQRIINKQSQYHQTMKKIYNQQVDRRLRERYADYSTIDPALSASRNDDLLSKEVQNFNNSKLNSGQSSRARQETRQFGLQYQPLQSIEPQNSPKLRIKHKPAKNFQNEPREEFLGPTKKNELKEDYRYVNPQMNSRESYGEANYKNFEHNYPYSAQQNNSPLDKNRYRSLQMPKNSPARQNLSKLVQELYTGAKIEQYPFKNIIPDKLQSHLREKMKADRQRAYKVTLNISKH